MKVVRRYAIVSSAVAGDDEMDFPVFCLSIIPFLPKWVI